MDLIRHFQLVPPTRPSNDRFSRTILSHNVSMLSLFFLVLGVHGSEPARQLQR